MVSETCAPVLLRSRAAKLFSITGKFYVSKTEHYKGKQRLVAIYKISLSRPWVLLIREPIVLLLSIYTAIVYKNLYLTFVAFPIVYQDARYWSQGMGGLAFIGVAVGMVLGIMLTVYDNQRDNGAAAKHGGAAPPEERLPPTMIGAVVLPVGLFIFAWTYYLRIHWVVSMIFSGAPGFGNVMLFLSVSNYLIDTYTVTPPPFLQRMLFFDLSSAPRSPFSPPTCFKTWAFTGLRESQRSWRLHVHPYRSCSTGVELQFNDDASTLCIRPK